MSQRSRLSQIYNACDPYQPAAPAQYVDCEAARGGSGLIPEFLRHLELANDSLCFLVSGHLGCGKSSELAQLCHSLDSPASRIGRYFPVLLDVSDYLDDYDVSLQDILLAIVTELSAEFKTRLKIDLGGNFFVRLLASIKEFAGEIEIKGELSAGWKVGPVDARVIVQRLKKDPSARRLMREALEPRISKLLEEMNRLFEEARRKLQELPQMEGDTRYEDFVVVVDNLEKIRKLSEHPEGLASQRELFVERYVQLTGFKAHMIYTVPLRLVRSIEGPQLIQRYGSVFVLPMVKIAQRGSRDAYHPGIACLHELLEKRLDGATIRDVIEDKALDFLVGCCGGNVRQFLIFIQNACTYTPALPIPLSAAHKAIAQTVRVYSTSIPEEHWTRLAELDLSTNQQIKNGDPGYLELLESLSVLEYINGGEEHDPYSPAEPWYSVHPVVRELRKFKESRAAVERKQAEIAAGRL